MLLSWRAAAISGLLVWGSTVDGLESSFGTAIADCAAVLTVALMFVIATVILRSVPDRSPRAQCESVSAAAWREIRAAEVPVPCIAADAGARIFKCFELQAVGGEASSSAVKE
jgi:hypothetical protein